MSLIKKVIVKEKKIINQMKTTFLIIKIILNNKITLKLKKLKGIKMSK